MLNNFKAEREGDINRTARSDQPRQGMMGSVKNDIIAAIGEFIGTIMFLLFALGAIRQAITPGDNEGDSVTNPLGDATFNVLTWWYISAAFGLSLFVFASIFYRFTGSIFNPSVGLALCLCRVIGPVRFALTAIAQMLGGIVASAILHGLTPGSLVVQTRLGPGTNRTRGVFIEAFATCALTLCVLMLGAEKSNLTPFAPFAFGMTLFVVMLFSIAYTGGAVNTARAFGPDVVSRSFASYHWIYWLGPALGALVAAGIYYTLKAVGYWRVNPNQDTTDPRQSAMAGDGPGATNTGYNGAHRPSDATYHDNSRTGGVLGNKTAGNGFTGNGTTTSGGLNAPHGTTTTAGPGGMSNTPTYPTGANAV